MPEVSDEAFDAAITAPDRRPTWSLRADWDQDGTYGHPLSDLTDLCDAIEVERSMQATLPGAGILDGVASAALKTTLAGSWDPLDENGPTASSALAPYQPDAELYGRQIVGTPLAMESGFVTEHGERYERVFTGRISRTSSSSKARIVALDAVDESTRMRAPIFQPPMAMDSRLVAAYGTARYSSRINSQWLIDRIARANGIFASPPPQPGSFLSVTGHGSMVPEIGSGGMPLQASYATPSTSRPWTNFRHPFGMLFPSPAAPAQEGSWTAPNSLTMEPGDGVGCSFWMRCPTTPIYVYSLMGARLDGGDLAVADQQFAIVASLIDGAPAMLAYTPKDGFQGFRMGDAWDLPRDPNTWRHIGMHWAFKPGAVEMSLAIDGQQFAPIPFSIDISDARLPWNKWAPTSTIEYTLDAPITNISWWQSPTYPSRWVGAQWESQADIDPGLNELTGIPELAGEDSWPLAQEVAAAETAQVGFNSRARFFFRSRAVYRPFTNPKRLTAERDLADMVTTVDEATVRNAISSASTPILVGDYEPVIEATKVDQFACGPGATRFTFPLPAGTVAVDPEFSSQRNAPGFSEGWTTVKDRTDWRSVWIYAVVYKAYPHIVVDPALINVRIFSQTAAEVTFVIFNYTATTIQFQTEDILTTNEDGTVDRREGQPAFRIPGRLVKAAATTAQNITDPGSIAAFGERTYQLGGTGGSRWHHFPTATRGVSESILPLTARPIPTLDAVEVLHDPRRDVNAPVVVADPAGLGEVAGTVAGITEHWAAGSAVTDKCTVWPRTAPGLGILEESGIGTDLRFGA